jgi:hypothetical protein
MLQPRRLEEEVSKKKYIGFLFLTAQRFLSFKEEAML